MKRRFYVAIGFVLLVAGCTTTPSRVELAEEYFNLGNAFYELGRYDESFHYYNRALALKPELPAISYNLARLYIDREDYLRAIDILLDLQRGDAENVLVQETLAYAWYRAGNVEEAYRLYRAVAVDYPGRADAVFNAGRVAGELGKWSDILPVLREGIATAESDAGLYWLLSTALHEGGDADGALTALDTYATLAEGDSEKVVALADRYYDWSYYLPAIETYGIALDTGEVTFVSRFRLAAATMLGTDDFDSALDAIAALFVEDGEAEQILANELESLQERLPEEDWALVEEAVEAAQSAPLAEESVDELEVEPIPSEEPSGP